MNPRIAFLGLVLALPAPLGAQELRLEGRSGSPAVTLAREILAGEYLRIERDTILPADFLAPGDVVIVDAEVRLEGVVEGRMAILGGDLFVRPGARIGGPIAVVGGGLYRSGLAEIGVVVEDLLPLEVAIRADSVTGNVAAVRVIPPPSPSPVSAPGLLGLRIPSYDRVNALTVGWGGRLRISPRDEGARADGWVTYRSARRSVGGGVELRGPLGRSGFAAARAARETRTPDAWIRGDFANSLAALFTGSDERDYHESDRVSLSVGKRDDLPLLAGEADVAPQLELLLTRDRSLATRDPWSLFGSLDRMNPAIDEGMIASATVGAKLRARGRVSAFAGGAWVEHGFGGIGDFQFTQWRSDALYQTLALRQHTLSIRFHGQATLAGDAPRQRWSFVGGPSTLPTFPTAEQRGDQVFFVETAYGVPLNRITLPIVGSPILRLTHRTGAAWRAGEEMPGWLQNVGVGFDLSVLRVALHLDPAAPRLGSELGVVFLLPGSR
ncbi:MAG: hypothetical protein M3483_06190 [Gemmatimonadota bacterium]|nr:hypothetical protein [Gemmatimonadota bacterium]